MIQNELKHPIRKASIATQEIDAYRRTNQDRFDVSSIHTSSLIHHHLHAKDAAARFHEFAGVYFDGVETVFLQCRD